VAIRSGFQDERLVRNGTLTRDDLTCMNSLTHTFLFLTFVDLRTNDRGPLQLRSKVHVCYLQRFKWPCVQLCERRNRGDFGSMHHILRRLRSTGPFYPWRKE
jgi:hypothetical protein